jgi:hypothetical protein
VPCPSGTRHPSHIGWRPRPIIITARREHDQQAVQLEGGLTTLLFIDSRCRVR